MKETGRALSAGGIDEVQAQEDVELGGALGSRASCDAVEAALLFRSELASALGDVGDDRGSGLAELQREVSASRREVLEEGIDEDDEVEGGGVDVELVMVESHNLLFRWFLDMDMLEDSFDPSTFTKNRQRLMEHEVAAEFFGAVLGQARDEGLVSREHFSVDGTLIEAWASMKSFRPKGQDDADNNGWGEFKGQRRSNDTHESKTDPEARLLRKGRGREAKLCFTGHALMDNRNGLLVDLRVSQADGYAERNVALQMLQELGEGRATVGADRAYDTKDFVARCRQAVVTPHVAQNENARRRSAIDGRTTRHQGYRISQRIRMRIEQIFGWIKSVGGLRRTRFRGRRKTQHAAYMVGAAYNLLRLARMQDCVS